ncbi:hypothetical protein AB0J52_00315 [Spirillospora sp. NPDC049652]
MRVRLSGDDADLQQLIELLRPHVTVHEESGAYPNRRDPGVRRYLLVEIPPSGGA